MEQLLICFLSTACGGGKIYANHLKFCKTAVFVVCHRDNHVIFWSIWCRWGGGLPNGVKVCRILQLCFYMKRRSWQMSERSGSARTGSCAFKLRHYTAFRRLPLLCALAWAEAVGCESSSSDMSGAFSSCCGEYRNVPADSRTVVPIGAANSVHTSLLIVQKRAKVVRFCTTFNRISLN